MKSDEQLRQLAAADQRLAEAHLRGVETGRRFTALVAELQPIFTRDGDAVRIAQDLLKHQIQMETLVEMEKIKPRPSDNGDAYHG